MLKKNVYKIIGLMSGSSGDGLDIAAFEFSLLENNNWDFEVLLAECYPYSKEWESLLKSCPSFSGLELLKAHTAYGKYTGQQVLKFLEKNQAKIGEAKEFDLVVSHGHTVFHYPTETQMTFQLGEGSTIAEYCGINVLSDLRNRDVAAGGQGAPLVPLGDKYLFSDYDYCLNLGGIANISTRKENGNSIGYDLCACNLILNKLASKLGFNYDDKGRLAANGKINKPLLKRLNNLDFCLESPPKSLGLKWVWESCWPIVEAEPDSIENKLCTMVEHIAMQVGKSIGKKSSNSAKLLVTGGGAFNDFLISRFKSLLEIQVCVPDKETVEYKEALIMAFLGVRYLLGKPTAFASVTGAQKDTVGGALHIT